MKNLLRIAKSAGLVAVLALCATVLTLIGDGATVASASTINALHIPPGVRLGPTISPQYYTTQSGVTWGYITGSYFTPGGKVFLAINDPSGPALTGVWTIATSTTMCNLSGQCTGPGAITVYDFGQFQFTCKSYYNIRAFDLSARTWSNTVQLSDLPCLQ